MVVISTPAPPPAPTPAPVPVAPPLQVPPQSLYLALPQPPPPAAQLPPHQQPPPPYNPHNLFTSPAPPAAAPALPPPVQAPVLKVKSGTNEVGFPHPSPQYNFGLHQLQDKNNQDTNEYMTALHRQVAALEAAQEDDEEEWETSTRVPSEPELQNWSRVDTRRPSPDMRIKNTWLDWIHYTVGNMQPSWCIMTINVTSWFNMSQLLISRADLFWYCGGRRLWNFLPQSWSGTCTLVRLTLPLLIMGHHKDPKQVRASRSVQTDFDLTKNSPTYVDAIGIPRGVPDEYKLANPWLANLTRDEVAGLSEQLMSLDMLLTERGGVCTMFGSACCTFIPNNTTPDGSVPLALEGLRTLYNEMAEHSGIEDSLGGWFISILRKYETMIISLMVYITTFTILTCCSIPCLHMLINCLIITALSKEQTPPPYQMLLLESHVMDQRS
uniref:Uncharacterized protein n=1 Tax=Mola mola TaxID=94237 RepID=A0A3Q3VVF4_MOLML